LIEKYSNRFKCFQKKIDSNNEIPTANVIWQFLSELNLIITFLVYANILADLQVTIDIAKSIKVGYRIIQKNIQ